MGVVAAEESAYDAGTAYLTIEARLEKGWEGKLAGELGAFPALPVTLAMPDLKAFANDLDAKWKDLDHRLPVELVAANTDKLANNTPVELLTNLNLEGANEKLEAFRKRADEEGLFLVADLNFERADAQLAEFFRVVPVLEIPAALNLTEALEQLALLRAEAARGVTIPAYIAAEIVPASTPGSLSTSTAQSSGQVGLQRDVDAARLREERDREAAAVRSEREMDAAQRRTERAYELRGAPAADRPGLRLDHSLADADIRKAQREEDAETRRRAREEDAARSKARQDGETARRDADREAKRLQQETERTAATAKREALKPSSHLDAVKQEFGKALGLDTNPNAKMLVGDLKQASSLLDEIAHKALRVTMIGGLIGAGGGLLAGLGALGAVGMIGAHGLKDAFDAQSAVSAEQRDPMAMQARAETLLEATAGQRDANEGLAESQWKVQDANLAAKLSVMDLADAYRDQTRTVRDASDALTDAQLRQQGSALSVARAREHLMRDQFSGSTTPLDIQSDVHDVQAAIQAYNESKKKTADQKVDTAITQQRGVDGSKPVMQAQQAVIDAQHGVTQALWGVQNATDRITEAAFAMSRAMNPEVINRLNVALQRLTLNARDFFNQIHALAPEFKTLQQQISTNLFDGLGGSLSKLVNDQLPALKQGLGGIASGMNSALKTLFVDLDGMFAKLESDGTMKKFIDGVTQLMQGLAPFITDIVQTLITLGGAVGPSLGTFFKTLGDVLVAISPQLGGLAKAFLDDLVSLLPSLVPGLQSLGRSLTDMLQVLGPELPKVGTALSNLLVAAEPLMGPLMKGIAVVLGLLASAIADWNQVTEPFTKWVGDVLGPVLDKMGGWFDTFETRAKNVTDKLTGLESGFHGILSPITDVKDAFQEMSGWVDHLVGGLEHLGSRLGSIAGAGLVKSFIGDLTGHADGGMIRGAGSGRSDSNVVAVSDGEFIVNAAATAKHRPLLDSINSGAPGYADGGLIRDLSLAHAVTARKPIRITDRLVSMGIKGFADGGPVDGSPTNQSMASTDAASGGPVNALTWVNAHSSIPYVWGGHDADGADCSGIVGVAQQVAQGIPNPTRRLGTTMTVLSGGWPGFISGATSSDLFVVGANDHHMVASILGTDIEERETGENIRIGKDAASPFDGQFTTLGHIDPKLFIPPYVAGNTGGAGKAGGTAALTPGAVDTPNTSTGGTTGTPGVSAPLDNSTDASANQALFPPGQVPTTWSGLATAGIDRLAKFALNGTGPIINTNDPLAPVQYTGITGALQGGMNTTVQGAPKGQQDYLSRFFFGTAPSVAPATGTATPGVSAAVDNRSDITANQGTGGLLGTLQKIVTDPQVGLAHDLGVAVAGQMTSAEQVFGLSDSMPGWAVGGIEIGNLLMQAGMQPPKTGDPSTTQPTVTKGAGKQPVVPDGGKAATSAGPDASAGGGKGASTSGLTDHDAYAESFGASPSLIAMVKGQAKQFGWDTGSEWDALDHIIGLEAGWNQTASAEPASDAYGLGQFLSTTWATVGGTKTDDPALQARYMDLYIQQRYGDPIKALDKRQTRTPQWYSGGGEVDGPGSSISDSIAAWLSRGEYVVNANSMAADPLNKPMLAALNKDGKALAKLVRPQFAPTKPISSMNMRPVDNSMTVHLTVSDAGDAMRRLKLLESQRAAKSAAYQGASRG